MSFVAKHLRQADERLILITRPHWVYVTKGFIGAALSLLVGLGIAALIWYFDTGRPPQQDDVMIGLLSGRYDTLLLAFSGIAACLFLTYALKWISTEVVITSRRLIHKHGLLFVELEEVDLREVTERRVDHGMLGAFLGYGSIYLDCRLVGDIQLPILPRPHRFLQILQRASAEMAAPGNGDRH